MDDVVKINSEHENLRRAIEVGSSAIKNLKSTPGSEYDVYKELKALVIESAKKLTGLIK